MSRPRRFPYPATQFRATALGKRLKSARLRRRIPETEMAARVGISRMTLRRLEEGDPSVGLAILLMVLDVLGLEKDIDEIARIDQIGLKALESEALGPRRSSRSEIADDL